MGRRALISRARHQFWLAHKIASQQPLVARAEKHRLLGRDPVVPRPRFIDPPMPITTLINDGLPSINRGRGTTGSLPIHGPDADLIASQTKRDDDDTLYGPDADLVASQTKRDDDDTNQINDFSGATGSLPIHAPDTDLVLPQTKQVYDDTNQIDNFSGRDPVVPRPRFIDPSTPMTTPINDNPPSINRGRGTTGSLPIHAMDADLVAPQTKRDQDDTIHAPDANLVAPQTKRVDDDTNQIDDFSGGDPVLPHEEIDQSPIINESIDAQSQQEHVDNSAQPVENVKTRRQRGRIQEQPAGPQQTNSEQKIPIKESVVQTERKSQPKRAADDLFVPQNIDRSPQAWMARLMGTTNTDDITPPEEPTSPRVRPAGGTEIAQGREAIYNSVRVNPRGDHTPEGTEIAQGREAIYNSVEADHFSAGADKHGDNTPLSQNTIRFLQPLVGIDPTNIRVHRDTIAERLTAHYQADAIAIGDDVEVAAGHQEDTPETLGLLAHEFTHVARRQEPHFIPPIAHSVRSPFSPSATDEEALAQRVEGRVKRIAQTRIDQLQPTFIEPLNSIEPTDKTVALEPRTPDLVPATSRSSHDAWGGLPAPWEPLPDWMVPSPTNNIQATISQMTIGGNRNPETSPTYGNVGIDAWTPAMPGNAGVQRAGQERSSNTEDTQPTTSTQPDIIKTPEPDLDALAQQVYTLLKRRMGVEHRREM